METAKRAMDLLRQTEETLRGFVSEAAHFGDYSSVVTIASWAQAINDLTKFAPGGEPKLAKVRSAPKLARVAAGTSHHRSSSHNRNGYPRFVRQGDYLVRISWSKREKKEYRHKAPFSILKALATAMADKGGEGRVFSTDEFLPIHEVSDGGQVPNYQAYVGISLLKKTGLIDQHGRQGYSIPRITEFKSAVEAIWETIPKE